MSATPPSQSRHTGAGTGAVPALTVVVPSYNRRDALECVLGGLAAQRGLAPGALEVVVVLDGSTDGSDAMLAAWQAAGRRPGLRWQLQPNGGQGAARDAGARAAAAPVLLFVDDDVVPEPDLAARHLHHHAAGERLAVLGDCELVRDDAEHPLYTQATWSWWEQLYASRVLPGRVPCYTDFCSGNVSIRRDDYLASGGFDPEFRGYGGEDYDLGYRLLQMGVRLVADREARGLHYHRLRSYAGLMRTRRSEGRADVLLGRKHPELRAGLRLASPYGVGPELFAAREMPAALLRARTARISLYERLGLRRRWYDAVSSLSAHHYWRGVYDALGSWEAWDAFQREATLPVRTVEVGRGLAIDPADFWVHGPSELRVTADGEPLGTARLAGPVARPLAQAVADAIGGALTGPLLVWGARTGRSPWAVPSRVPARSLFPPAADWVGRAACRAWRQCRPRSRSACARATAPRASPRRSRRSAPCARRGRGSWCSWTTARATRRPRCCGASRRRPRARRARRAPPRRSWSCARTRPGSRGRATRACARRARRCSRGGRRSTPTTTPFSTSWPSGRASRSGARRGTAGCR